MLENESSFIIVGYSFSANVTKAVYIVTTRVRLSSVTGSLISQHESQNKCKRCDWYWALDKCSGNLNNRHFNQVNRGMWKVYS